MPNKICPNCGVEYYTTHKLQTYCSKKCSSAAKKAGIIKYKSQSEPVDKTCPTCSNTFKTMPPGATSRSYPKFTQVFCSKPCAERSRFRSGEECKELTIAQAAYIAGFMDGEGSVILYMRRDSVALRAVFANCDPRPLAYMQEVTGAGNLTEKGVKDDTKHRGAFFTAFNSTAAYTLLKQIEPYLLIKREQALLGIEFFERIKDPALKADRTWQYEYRERLQHMNRRGPR